MKNFFKFIKESQEQKTKMYICKDNRTDFLFVNKHQIAVTNTLKELEDFIKYGIDFNTEMTNKQLQQYIKKYNFVEVDMNFIKEYIDFYKKYNLK